MTGDEREPTRDELLAMAYVDSELDREAREQFEGRLATDRALLREVSELKRLAVIARNSAPPEPMDHEWNRLEGELLHGGGSKLAYLLMLVGTLGIGGWAIFMILADDELELVPKILLSCVLGGLAIAFLLTLRARLRTLPHDPYTEVKR